MSIQIGMSNWAGRKFLKFMNDLQNYKEKSFAKLVLESSQEISFLINEYRTDKDLLDFVIKQIKQEFGDE